MNFQQLFLEWRPNETSEVPVVTEDGEVGVEGFTAQPTILPDLHVDLGLRNVGMRFEESLDAAANPKPPKIAADPLCATWEALFTLR